ncbi:MAG TPA: energy transducer TonB, partial [Flavisolibacter sp.]|nr:energy transducer TonB [Flavisolibacter sp.]
MTSQQILQSDFLDILFEKRNKLYGAYLLRRNYPLELMKALGITLLLVLALLFFGNSSGSKQLTDRTKDEIIISHVVLPDAAKPELP